MKCVMFFFFLLLASIADAHTNEYLDKIPAPHGGKLRMSGAYHFELVLAPGEITVYVTDHGDRPIETIGGSAISSVRIAKREFEVILQPSGGNKFRGSGDIDPRKVAQVRLKVTLPGAKPVAAMFKFSPQKTTPDDAPMQR